MSTPPLPGRAVAGVPGTLRTRTVRVHGAMEDVPLLDLVPDVEAPLVSAWVRRGEGIVGWGRAATTAVTTPARFADARAWWEAVTHAAVVEDEVALPGSGLVCFGSFAYAAASPAGSTLVAPEVVVGRRDGVTWVTTTAVEGPAPQPPALLRRSDHRETGPVTVAPASATTRTWSATVEAAVAQIAEGRLDKVVLARSETVTAAAPIDARTVLRRLAARYDATWVFAVDGLVGATPEMLVRLERGLVTSRVLAGTIRRTGDDAADAALAGSLARSSKDLEEHEYAVRSVADALAPHTSSMNVPEAPFVLHLANVMHLATDVTAVVSDDVRSLDLAASLHPSAAVCGTPTPVADELIAATEELDRGRYAGPVGWMSASGDGEWGIALRCGRITPGAPSEITLYAGCGIVAGSDADAEVAESEAKLVPMREAVGV